MRSLKFYLIIVAAVAVGALSVWSCFRQTGKEASDERMLVSRKRIVDKGSNRVRVSSKKRPSAKPVATRVKVERIRPTMDIGDEEEARLTEAQRQLLAEIKKAMDEEDRKLAMRLIQRLQSSPEWPDGVPNSIKKAAIDALGWFGGDCLPEIAGFLMDADQDIIDEAAEVLENRLMDANGDEEISQIIIAASKMLNDVDAMESILMEMSNMRNSRIVSTIKEIWRSGTEAAKRALPDAIEFATAEENISSPEQLDAWYNDPSGDNLDGEDAEDIYGPMGDD